MTHRDSDRAILSINGKSESYKLLKFFEFTSDRKMMSVVVKRESDNRLFLFSKGADGVIIPKSVSSKGVSDNV